jgi:hypothetical protein
MHTDAQMRKAGGRAARISEESATSFSACMTRCCAKAFPTVSRKGLTAELLSFPGCHDAQVDALTQGLAWGRTRRGEFGVKVIKGMV